MRKLVSVFLVSILVLCFVGCSENTDDHIGEAKTPSGSSIQEGRMYQEVIDEFSERGFTNVQVVALEDLITGWLTKDGEVENVSVDGDIGYSSDAWYPNDVEVIITYHTFPVTETNEVVEANEPEASTEPEVSEEPEASQEPEVDYSQINQLISERLLECQGWALGLLDGNGNPTENGEPSLSYSFSLLIIDTQYTGDQLLIRVLPDFEELSDEEKTYVINMTQGNANAITEHIPYTVIAYANGDRAGHSKVTNSEVFKWE